MMRAKREDALIVAIMRDGQVFFGNDRMPAEELAAKISERLNHRGERNIYIRVDARVLYGYVSRSCAGNSGIVSGV
jgi:biopolymer transport protein ExbD